MSNLAAIGTGVALAAVLVAAVSVRRDEAQPSKPIAFEARLEMDMPVLPKADRLPLPELLNLPDTAEGRTPDAAISGATRGGKEAAPMTVVRAVGAASTKQLDPVCGPRGRTYYTKNGWNYWRCQR